jgi:hypothetical protein
MKKIFIISAVLLVLVLFFLGIYNFAFRKDSPKVALPGAPETSREKQEKDAQKKSNKISNITGQPVLGPLFDKKTESISFYSAKDGSFWTVDETGFGEKQVDGKTREGLKDVLWSQDHGKVLMKFERNGRTSFAQADSETRTEKEFKEGMDTVVWNHTGYKIFYKYYDAATQKRSINIANFDGSGWSTITETELKNLSLASIPSTALLSFWNFPNADEETQLKIVEAIGGEPKTILSGKFGADYLWSPDGTQALVSSLVSKDSKMTNLGIVKIDGQYQDLKIPTFVSKCVWARDGKSFYYALPGEIPDKAKLPNDYQEKKFMTDDTFWKMNITTGETNRIVNADEINGKYDSSQFFLSASEGDLFFVNRSDQKLYKINL